LRAVVPFGPRGCGAPWVPSKDTGPLLG